VPALTEAEARTRSRLLGIESYEVFLDLTAEPVRSRSEVRFRCREPGAGTFADLTASMVSAVLNGQELGPPTGGRLTLPPLRPVNVLTVEAEAGYARIGRGLTRFRDPADGADYVSITCYPSHAPAIFGCFDQPDLSASMTFAVAAPAGWECFGNGPVVQRPAAGQAGVWRFGAVPGTPPFAVALCAGPFATGYRSDDPARGGGGPLAMTVRHRRSLAGADGVAGLARFGADTRDTIARYGRLLGVPCPYPNYDVVFVPDLTARAYSVPGLMLVNESLLARMTDPDDDFVAMLCTHETAHLWFGGLVNMRWWDDVWLDEAIATYLSYLPGTGPDAAAAPAAGWLAFCYREKERAYLADELPGREPVSSPVADAGAALAKPAAITYVKGASVIRQLGAQIGDGALHAGLSDYLTRCRAAGVGALDDLVGCWSRASGRELAGWAGEWLRTEGVSLLRPELTPAPDGTIGSLVIHQDSPDSPPTLRTQQIGIGLYDRDGTRLRRRRLVSAQVSGARTDVPGLAGDPLPSALVLNDGDLSYTRISFDEASLRALAGAAMDVGDPLTEAVCWNAAWHMVRSGQLAAADLAALIVRRAAGGDLPLEGTEVLLERAVGCADVFAPPADRARIRERVAGAVARLARQAVPGSPRQRALARGFAAAAQSDGQLGLLRAWLAGAELPAGLALTADLRSRILYTLSARGLASDADLDTLAGLDPVQGEQHRATCRAMRPDPGDKEAAWLLALARDGDWRMAQASARGLWVPGQEELMTGYLDRYLSQALTALDGHPEPRLGRGLARLLYPATLVARGTLAATAAALRDSRLSDGLQLIVREQDAILRAALTARSAARRPGLA
jgi:aminopeptidase N